MQDEYVRRVMHAQLHRQLAAALSTCPAACALQINDEALEKVFEVEREYNKKRRPV